jgi:gliding motility associated protien GldN
MKYFLIGVLATSFIGMAQAQPEGINGGPVNVQPGGVVDGVYIQEHIPTKKLIPYEHVREADVVWSKRVWSFIDLREKVNHPLYYPFDKYQDTVWVKNSSRWSLWTVLKHHILNGDLTMYAATNPYDPFEVLPPDGDQFKYPIEHGPGLNYESDPDYRSRIDEGLYILGARKYRPRVAADGTDSVTVDPFTGAESESLEEYQEKSVILSEHIVQYHIKEDWFFDKERSVLDVRILGIAPVIYRDGVSQTSTGPKEGGVYQEKFWLYFPHCRYVLNNYFAYNDQNDAQWMSFDDLFWKRRFSSVMYKESNVYDRKVDSYKAGVDALFEAEKIKEEIRTLEHDVWSF